MTLIRDTSVPPEEKLVRWDGDGCYHRATLHTLRRVDGDAVPEGAHVESNDPQEKSTHLAIFFNRDSQAAQVHQLLTFQDPYVEIPNLAIVPENVRKFFEEKEHAAPGDLVLARIDLPEWVPAVVLMVVPKYDNGKEPEGPKHLCHRLFTSIRKTDDVLMQDFEQWKVDFDPEKASPQEKRSAYKGKLSDTELSVEHLTAFKYQKRFTSKEVNILDRKNFRKMHRDSAFKLAGIGVIEVFPEVKSAN